MTDRAKQIIDILQVLPDRTPHILCIPRPDDVPGNHPVMLSMSSAEAVMMLGEIVDGCRLGGFDVDELLDAVKKYVENKAS